MNPPPNGLPKNLCIQLRISGILPTGFPLSDVGIGWPQNNLGAGQGWQSLASFGGSPSLTDGAFLLPSSVGTIAAFTVKGYSGPGFTGANPIAAAYGNLFDTAIYGEPFVITWNGNCWTGLYDYSPASIPGLLNVQHLLVGCNVAWQNSGFLSCGITLTELPAFQNSGRALNQSAIGWPSGVTVGVVPGPAVPPFTTPQIPAAIYSPSRNLGQTQNVISPFEYVFAFSPWSGGTVVFAGATYLPTSQTVKTSPPLPAGLNNLSYSPFTMLPANYTIYVTYLGVGPV